MSDVRLVTLANAGAGCESRLSARLRSVSALVEHGLLRDEDWRPLDGEICRVIAFRPMAGRVEGTEVKSSTRSLPYAAIEIESPALNEPTTGFIIHKLDFRHLWRPSTCVAYQTMKKS